MTQSAHGKSEATNGTTHTSRVTKSRVSPERERERVQLQRTAEQNGQVSTFGNSASTFQQSSLQRADHNTLRPTTNLTYPNRNLQTKLHVSAPNDPFEIEAERVATQVMRQPTGDLAKRADTDTLPSLHIGTSNHTMRSAEDSSPAVTPKIERSIQQMNGGGKPLDDDTRDFFEQRIGAGFQDIRVHTDSSAIQTSRDIQARAFTVGNDIAFNAGEYNPSSQSGKHLLAHELAHTVQQGAASSLVRQPTKDSNTIARYRNKKAFNFGKDDSATLKEEEFNSKTKQPWIEQITITLNGVKTDKNGLVIATGTLTASYHGNAVALPDITLSISGGSKSLGMSRKSTDSKVDRIEGIGYNDQPMWKDPNFEGPNKKYAKNDVSSMSYAVFYIGGEAVHMGDLDVSSHGCIHVADWDKMQQVNYHSVVNLTNVTLTYDPAVYQQVKQNKIAP